MISNKEKREWSKTVWLETLATQAKSQGREAKSKGQRWHYLTLKKLSALLKQITSKHSGDFYCLNCLHSLATRNKIESHKKVCENEYFLM